MTPRARSAHLFPTVGQRRPQLRDAVEAKGEEGVGVQRRAHGLLQLGEPERRARLVGERPRRALALPLHGQAGEVDQPVLAPLRLAKLPSQDDEPIARDDQQSLLLTIHLPRVAREQRGVAALGEVRVDILCLRRRHRRSKACDAERLELCHADLLVCVHAINDAE
eukprot:1520815-Prymnesium_polylepis.1